MNLWQGIQIALGLGAAIRGAHKQMRDEGLPIPEILDKANAQAERLEVVAPTMKEQLDEYDRFLDTTAQMGAGIRVFRVLADGTLDADPVTGELVQVDVTPGVAHILDKAMDTVRKDPPPKPVDGAPASP